MIDHQYTLIQLKSELMDLWSKDAALQSYEKWFAALQPKINKYFNVEESDFFVYDKNGFIPLKGHRSAVKLVEAIEFNFTDESTMKANLIKLFQENGIEFVDDVLLFKNDKLEPLGILLVQSTEDWRAFSETSYIQELESVIGHLIQTIGRLGYLVNREKNFRQLFNVTELFNSTMDSHVILDGIMHAIHQSFPTFDFELLLSHDQKELTQSYKLFDYMNERASAINAFVSGDITIENAADIEGIIMNAPIKGRQGIYGVLQIKAPTDYIFSRSQRNFIQMLANTAGSALENASLYEQSHRLVEDLQLVNETSRKLNSNMYFNEMLSYLKQQLLKAFRPKEIAFVFYDKEDSYLLSEVSSNFFSTTEGEVYLNYTSTYLKGGKEALFDASFKDSINEETLYQSVVSVPITNQDKMVGFVVCLHDEPYYFSFDNFKLMRSLIGHSSLALANSMMREQLQELVDKDYLTKLFTRSFLDKAVEESIAKSEGGLLILLDIDDFKFINDSYGHEVGDQVLVTVSAHILSTVKGKGVAARWGGEEFAIYLPKQEEEIGVQLASNLVREIPRITKPSITISVGLHAWTSTKPITFKELFHHTDTSLYEAKNTGKNKLVH